MRAAYAWLWLGWLTMFAAVEFTALGTGHPEDTLSEYVWRLEGAGWTAARYLVAVVLLWALLHLTLGWFK